MGERAKHLFRAELWVGSWAWSCDCTAVGWTFGDPYEAWLQHLPASVLSGQPEADR